MQPIENRTQTLSIPVLSEQLAQLKENIKNCQKALELGMCFPELGYDVSIKEIEAREKIATTLESFLDSNKESKSITREQTIIATASKLESALNNEFISKEALDEIDKDQGIALGDFEGPEARENYMIKTF